MGLMQGRSLADTALVNVETAVETVSWSVFRLLGPGDAIVRMYWYL